MRRNRFLTAREVASLARSGKDGRYAVGCDCLGSLKLSIKTVGNSRSVAWLYRRVINGRPVHIGLGAFSSKADAPGSLGVVRELVKQIALDPVAYKKQKVESSDALQTATCEELFPMWIDKQRDRHAWTEKGYSVASSRLRMYAAPVIGTLKPEEVTRDHVVQILSPICKAGMDGPNGTSSKVRVLLKQFFDWCADDAKVRDPEKANPAGDVSRLNRLLPKPGQRKARHQPACPLEDLPRFVALLTEKQRFGSAAAMGLLFAILTCSRHANIARQEGAAVDSYAVWEDFDLDVPGHEVWRIPAAKMKEDQNGDHVVPLSAAAVAILRRMELLGLRDDSGVVFHKGDGVAFSNSVFRVLIKKLSDLDKANGGTGFVDPEQDNRLMTPHGTARGSFRSWCAREGKDSELAELALHHSQGKVHDAYQRDKAIERRRELMEEWAAFCLSASDPDWAKLP